MPEENAKNTVMDGPDDFLPIDDPRSFQDLMRRVREGSEDAAWEVFERHGGYILRAVRRVLNPKLRSKFDSIDFTQRVWLSFYRVRDKVDHFETPQQLAEFLAGMARNKVHMEVRRRLLTPTYNVGREVRFDDVRDEDDSGRAAPQPEPIDAAIVREQWERLLQDQPPHYRRIIELKSQGYSCVEIGTILSLDARTVRRFLKRLFLATNV